MLTFTLAAIVLVVIPGPDMALITRSALTGGRRAGLLATLGGVLGLTVHGAAASAGLSALLLASATAFTVMKAVGAVYLVWMGVQTLRTAARTRREAAPAADEPERAAVPPLTALRRGFLSNALNPKIALFFVTFLPQFIDPDGAAPWARALLLSLVFIALYLSWFAGYVAAVDRLGRLLRRPRVRASVERVTGALLIAFAVRLATAHQ
ncbi:LysE family translocator [Actinomadura yumaensis]|uniref:LysE family translocator n=1 Tax=Actinomadura yumaensis TaxID=111807 RepID=A0ABW2CV71_9ACTN